MPPVYLRKSDFKAAFDCGTKLYYRKNRHPSAMDEIRRDPSHCHRPSSSSDMERVTPLALFLRS
jgi:hypothetical protein